jgi:hypothetical protein
MFLKYSQSMSVCVTQNAMFFTFLYAFLWMVYLEGEGYEIKTKNDLMNRIFSVKFLGKLFELN